MELQIPETDDRNVIFTAVANYLGGLSLSVVDTDFSRPWGGFFVIDEGQTQEFIQTFFPDLSAVSLQKGGKLSPKLLVVEPNKRLSWQYHYRREEIWRVLEGPVGVVTSQTDNEQPLKTLQRDTIVQHGVETRHRLVGLDSWGVVAEIWQHTDPDNPSNENDIVRVQDDFQRS